jgi:hypothetical protein
MSAKNRQILMWSGAAVGVVAVLVVTYVVLRNRTPPPPPVVAQVEPPATTTTPPPVETPAPPVEDPNKALNEQDLQAARDMITAGNLAGALRDHVQPVLERDPGTVALDMKASRGANAARRRSQWNRKRLSSRNARNRPQGRRYQNTRLA